VTAFVAGRAGAVGKVPTRAEYLPVPTSAPSFAAFDAWLSEATEWAVGHAGPAWSDAFTHGAMHGFVFRPPTEAPDLALCGALAPSRDCAGRLFPLALGAPLRVERELLRRPELLPFCLEGLWAAATSALADLMSERPPESSASLVSAAQAADLVEAGNLYDDWVSTLPLSELWALLGPALASPASTLRLLLEALTPTRGVELPTVTLSLRVPLGLGGGAGLCVWLDLVRRYLGWRATLPSFFWSHDGTSGTALLHLGRPPKTALAELWMPSGSRDEILDLTRPVDPALTEAFSPLPDTILAALSAPQATLAELLFALGA
jgi:type VI secretion system ImpM family protein